MTDLTGKITVRSTEAVPSTPVTSDTSTKPLHPTPATQPWIKRHWKWLTLVATLLIGGGGVYAWTLRPQPQPQAAAINHQTPKPPTPTPTPLKKASPLTGVMVDPAVADRPIVSVIVENHPDARPQSGLQDAGVVYEALAEGGITRFQTFFLDSQPPAIGPVRSLRPYFVDWGFEFNAPVAHAGGSADALNLASSTGMKDLNALIIGTPTFYRTNDRVAPHNLYTSSSLLDTLLAKRGFNTAPTFTPSPRQADHPNPSPPHPNIHIEYSYNGYQADYKYDPASNDYARSVGGAPHIDRNTGKQIHVKNIVVEMISASVIDDGHGHMQLGTTGRGTGWVIRDGDAIPCTWVKDSRTTRTRLLDASGKDIPLNAGNTWYSIVPIGKTVSF
jgi:hypothetical protein